MNNQINLLKNEINKNNIINNKIYNEFKKK